MLQSSCWTEETQGLTQASKRLVEGTVGSPHTQYKNELLGGGVMRMGGQTAALVKLKETD